MGIFSKDKNQAKLQHELLLAGASNQEQYLVTSRAEKINLLRNLAQSNTSVTAYFDDNKKNFTLTSVVLVSADNNIIALDFGPNDAANRQILQSSEVIFVTSLNRVHIEFIATKVAKASYKGSPVFKIAIPEKMLRLQRREFFRATTLMSNPPHLRFSLTEEEVTEEYCYEVTDLSSGGLGLIDSELTFPVKGGTVLEESFLEIPDQSPIELKLDIKNVRLAKQKDGTEANVIGCAYIDLNSGNDALIHRYISFLEREKKKT